MRQQPISNATRVGFIGERTWPIAPSNVICKTTFSCVFELTNRVGHGTVCGGSLRDVQELAGHTSLAMTQRYIEGDTEAKRKLVALL
jgi:hypothetical protein